MSLFDSTKKDEDRKQWLAERKKGIGGSDYPIIAGASPFKTPYKLWQEKTGLVEAEDISENFAVKRGNFGELECRAIIEARDNITYKPKSWTHPDNPTWKCNDDGYSLDTNVFLEIKCLGRATHDKCRTHGEVPFHYFLQCQWNLMVSGAERCIFVSYRPEDGTMHEIVIMPNKDMWPEMQEKAIKFWKHVEDKTPVELTPKDYKQIDDHAFDTITKAYVELKDKRDKLNEELTELEQQIKTYTSSHTAIMNSYVRVLKTTRKGTVDYGKMAAENSIDQEKYRKAPTTVCTISVL